MRAFANMVRGSGAFAAFTLRVAALAAVGSVLMCGALACSAPTNSPAREEGALWADDRPDNHTLPAWYELQGDVLTPTIDLDRVVHTQVSNYPTFGPSGVRDLDDMQVAAEVAALVNASRFIAAQSLDAWNESRKDFAGGYSTAVKFYDCNGDVVGSVSYNPDFPGGDGVAVLAEGTIYAMEGDQAPMIELMDDLVARYADAPAPVSGASSSGAAHDA